MSIGVTGHQRLRSDSAWAWVRGELQTILAGKTEPLVGISSLAIGADTLFAEVVLQLGGRLIAVIPFPSYREKFTSAEDLRTYEDLLQRSHQVEILPRRGSDEECYFAAGERVVALADEMIAVWNGAEAAGLGGTGDIVAVARKQGRKVTHLNPERQVVRVLQ